MEKVVVLIADDQISKPISSGSWAELSLRSVLSFYRREKNRNKLIFINSYSHLNSVVGDVDLRT